MRVSLLNLDRSQDRLASFLAHNQHLTDVCRVSATDGSRFTREYLRSVKAIEGDLPHYTNGAIGCALSHLGLWEQTAASGATLTLAEDDAILNHHFEAVAEEVLASLPEDWDIILWGWNFDSVLAFDLMPGVSHCVGLFNQEGIRSHYATFQRSAIAPKAFRLLRAFGTVCQSVSPGGAAKLLRHCLPLRPMEVSYPLLSRPMPNNGIDIMMSDLYPSINAYVCFPPLAVTCNDHAVSTVQIARATQPQQGCAAG